MSHPSPTTPPSSTSSPTIPPTTPTIPPTTPTIPPTTPTISSTSNISSSTTMIPPTTSSTSFHPRHLVSKSPTNNQATNESSTFVVMTYNILTDNAMPAGTYGYCDITHRYMPQRHLVIMEEIKHYRPSILCLQELDEEAYERYFRSSLQEAGYDSAICAYRKLNDVSLGEAIFYRREEFSCEASRCVPLTDVALQHIEEHISCPEVQQAVHQRLNFSNQAVLARLRHLVSHKAVHVVTTHILWANLKLVDVQTLQIAHVSQSLEAFLREDAGGGGEDVYIYTGDLNTPPHYPGYNLLLEEGLTPPDLHTLHHYPLHLSNNKTSTLVDEFPTRVFTPRLSYASAYRDAMGAEPQVTSMDDVWKLCLDYIWYSPQTLEVSTVVAPPAVEILNSLPGLPSARFPSDHIPMVASFTLSHS